LIPIYVAGVNTGLARLAGEVCEGFHVHPFHTLRYLREVILPAIDEGGRKIKTEKQKTKISVSAFVATNPRGEAARPSRVLRLHAVLPPVVSCTGRDGRKLSARLRKWSEMPMLISDEMLNESYRDRWIGPPRIKKRYDDVNRLTLYIRSCRARDGCRELPRPVSEERADFCIFCEIIIGRAEASRVHEDEICVAFMDIQPVTPGHVLVVPKVHAASLAELPPRTGGRMFQAAQRIASALAGSGVKCEGVNLFLADGEAAGQDVFHVHLHVIPRFNGDVSVSLPPSTGINRTGRNWTGSPARSGPDCRLKDDTLPASSKSRRLAIHARSVRRRPAARTR
jgi:diadenosine tetraphosphate (Ap4A) HIT family hydrolase